MILFFIISIISVFIIISCSCPFIKVYNFNERELSWIKNIHKENKIVLRYHNNCDTIFISAIEIDNKKTVSIFDLKSVNWLEGQNKYNATASISFILKHNEKQYPGIFIITKKNANPEITVSFQLGDLYSRHIIIQDSDNKIMFIDGINSELGINQERIGVHQVDWDKKNGINRIIYKNGESYTLLPKKIRCGL